jgi:hypothetical protein
MRRIVNLGIPVVMAATVGAGIWIVRGNRHAAPRASAPPPVRWRVRPWG